MKDILSEIVAHKRLEIERQKQTISIDHLREQVADIMQSNFENRLSSHSPRRSMKQALTISPSGIIAEFKRRSPSKDWIKKEALANIIPPAYATAGASALSILTDEKYFGGSLRDIRTARPLVDIPILRKDFIIDEYQLLQAHIIGADAVLLIAACLSPEECKQLTAQAHALQLEVLLEVHRPSELVCITPETDMVGVNNRNLGTFVTDIENSFHIAEELKATVAGLNKRVSQEKTETANATKDVFPAQSTPLLISESGISNPETIRRLRSAGFRGFLIGETFMRTEQPGEALKEFIQAI